jgi:patatin-like phospholipase/acyl hydrolase
MELTRENIERMQSVDITTVNPSELTDLNDIVIDTGKSVPEKVRQFAEQTDNLFVNRVGEYVVKVSYAENGVSINDKLRRYIGRLGEVDY